MLLNHSHLLFDILYSPHEIFNHLQHVFPSPAHHFTQLHIQVLYIKNTIKLTGCITFWYQIIFHVYVMFLLFLNKNLLLSQVQQCSLLNSGFWKVRGLNDNLCEDIQRHHEPNTLITLALNHIKSLYMQACFMSLRSDYLLVNIQLGTVSERNSSNGKFPFVMFLPGRFQGRTVSALKWMFCNQLNKTSTKLNHTPCLARCGWQLNIEVKQC